MNHLERAILDNAADDFIGLWEARWIAARGMGADFGEARASAEIAVRGLVERGLLEVFTGVEFDGEQVTVPASEQSLVLNTDLFWEEPGAGMQQARVGITDRGLRALRG